MVDEVHAELRLAGPRAPLGWEVLTWAVLAVTGAYLCSALYRIWCLTDEYRLARGLLDGSLSSTIEQARETASRGQFSYNAYMFFFVWYLASCIAWFFASRRLVEQYKQPWRVVLSHWTVGVWQLAILASLFVTLSMDRVDTSSVQRMADSLPGAYHGEVALLALRAVVAALLVAGLLVLRTRVRAAVATSGVPPRPLHDPANDKPLLISLPVTSFPDGAPEAAGAGPLRAADDEFWARVAESIEDNGRVLPVLEVTARGVRRWHLPAARSEIGAIQQRLLPGAALTVYPDAPRAVDEQVLADLAEQARSLIEEGHGPLEALVEEPGLRMLRHSGLSTQEEVSGWLVRARGAARAGVYPAGSTAGEGVLRVVVR